MPNASISKRSTHNQVKGWLKVCSFFYICYVTDQKVAQLLRDHGWVTWRVERSPDLHFEQGWAATGFDDFYRSSSNFFQDLRRRGKSGLFEASDSIKFKRTKIGPRAQRRPGIAQTETESGRRARLLEFPKFITSRTSTKQPYYWFTF